MAKSQNQLAELKESLTLEFQGSSLTLTLDVNRPGGVTVAAKATTDDDGTWVVLLGLLPPPALRRVASALNDYAVRAERAGKEEGGR